MSLQAPQAYNPGALDRRVRLDYPLRVRDGLGGATVTWVQGPSVWARKETTGGGRLNAADAQQFYATFNFRIRARNDVMSGWRLVHGDDVYEIVTVEEEGRAHMMQLGVRAIDQTPHTATALLLLHNRSPLTLHSGDPLSLHREQDAA